MLLAELEVYTRDRFEWGDLLSRFDSSRVLVRSDPDAETAIRDRFLRDGIDTRLEFGRYNMSCTSRSRWCKRLIPCSSRSRPRRSEIRDRHCER